MLTHILRFLGLASSKPWKSGKREAAWALMVIVIALTVYAMWIGIEMVYAMTAILMVLWPAAIAAMAAAYKLSDDNSKLFPSPSRIPDEHDRAVEDALAGGEEGDKP